VFRPLELGRLFGIQIRASWTFVLVLAALFFAAGQGGRLEAAWSTFVVLLLAVLMHEVGHALCAQRFGIQVVDITFWPLGGMARMSAVPESPRIEAWIALAGPLTNLLVALLVLPPLLIQVGSPLVSSDDAWWLRFLAENFWIHLSLGVFNLVPAFPMDGGRVLRSLLATRHTWLQATEQAVRVSRYVTLLLFLAGFLYAPRMLPILAIVALFLWWEGFAELTQVRLRRAAEFFGIDPNAGAAETGGEARHSAWQAAGTNPAEIGRDPWASAPPAAQAAASPAQTTAASPGLAEADKPVGAAPSDSLQAPAWPPEEGLSAPARRPVLWSVEPCLQRGRRHGFDAEVLRLLEAFPGPLRARASESP
jgi:Zn-dependent protease